MQAYANDNDGWYPDDPIRFVEAEYFESTRPFWHPNDSDALPAVLTNSELNAPDSVQVSFEFVAAGLNENHRVPGFVAWRDNTAANNNNLGLLQLEVLEDHSWGVVWRPDCKGDVDGDGDVDRVDLQIVIMNFGKVEGVNPWDGDVDGDGDVDASDRNTVSKLMGKRCDP
jgi:hypothetical protein